MVSEEKIKFVNELKEKIRSSKIISIANIMDIPSSSLQIIRKKLKDKGFDLRVVKKSLLIKALEDLSKENNDYLEIIKIIENYKRITIMLIIPKEEINPFLLNKILEESKSYREAREGDILDEDVIIKSGPTNFTAGPILSVFKKFNIKTKVEDGKIFIIEDAVVARKGEVVSKELAEFLQKMEIKPIKVKVKLLLVYDGKILYKEDILSIPLEKYIEDLKKSLKKAMAVSVEVCLPTRDNIGILLRKAYLNAYKLSIKSEFPTKETIKELLMKSIKLGFKLKEKINI